MVAAVKFYDLVRVNALTLGTGTVISVGGSVDGGFQSFPEAGVPNGTFVRYAILSGQDQEVGQGTYSAGTLSRDTVEYSTAAGARISIASDAEVYITSSAQDLNSFLRFDSDQILTQGQKDTVAANMGITLLASSLTDIQAAAAAAVAAAAAAAISADGMDDLYLGHKAADPTLDNDGNALQQGAMYYNTTSLTIKFWTGAAWTVPAAGGVSTFNGRNGAVVSANGDYTASQITNVPAGSIASTTLQAAINELATEKLDTGGAGYDALSIHGTDIASAATVNLETATGNLVDVTGTTTITAITLNDGHERTVRFTGALLLTNGASLVLPGGQNILTAAGDYAIFRGYAGGVVRCVDYVRKNGHPLIVGYISITSAATTDIGSDISQLYLVNGTTTITSFGSTAPMGAVKFITFGGTITVTHNAALVLPGNASMTMTAGDSMIARHEGAGNWRVIEINRGAGRPLNTAWGDTLSAGYNAFSFSGGTKSSGTFTPDPLNGNFQNYINGGAHTLAAPGAVCTMVLEVTNASAGAITFSGFNVVDGDIYSSTGTKKHIFYITRTPSYARITVVYVTGT